MIDYLFGFQALFGVAVPDELLLDGPYEFDPYPLFPPEETEL